LHAATKGLCYNYLRIYQKLGGLLTHRKMVYVLLKTLAQSLLMNSAVGFMYLLGTEYSRRQRILLGYHVSSGKRDSLPFRSLSVIMTLLKLCVNTIQKINRQWLFFILFKAMLDIVVFNFVVSSSFAEGAWFNLPLANVVLILSPLNLVQTALVVGTDYETDIATGLASGFYHGYLKLTAGFLKECISASRYREELGQVPKRFILVPENGILIDSLHKADDRITFLENTSTMKKDVGGVKQRSYFQSVYKFTPKNLEFEEFCCIAEQSASVRPIKDIVSVRGFSQSAVQQTVRRFYEEVRDLVKCNDVTHDSIEVILFSGREEDVVDAIVRRRKELLAKR